MKRYRFLLPALVVSGLWSCSSNPLKVNISSSGEEVKIIRYDDEMFSHGNSPGWQELTALHSRYPGFTDLFTHQIIRIGSLADSAGLSMFLDFVNDSVILKAGRMAGEKFRDFSGVENELISAFRHYRYYFPDKPLPDVYTCISGFNEPVFITGNIVGISLDKYLGADCIFYTYLDIPRYRQRKMIPEMIPVDVMRLWGSGEFEISRDATTLLDHIIYEGKLSFFTEAMMPSLSDTLLAGFTRKQLKWCENNEAAMWNYLIENKLLFSTKQMDIVRYINDGPATNGFPGESPARTGVWLGWQIIRSYMKHHPEVTLQQLMHDDHYQQILNASVYAP